MKLTRFLYHRAMPRDPTTLFADAIDVPLWLESDRGTPYAERVRRDRHIASQIASSNSLQRVRLWWRGTAHDADIGAGMRLDRLRGVVTVAMLALGAVTGIAVTLTAFAYDGSQPVNVVRLLALLVGTQLVLLALTLLSVLPGGIPGLRHVQELLAALNPGAWAGGVYAKLARPPPDVARLFERPTGRAAAARFAKWQLLYWSQCAAVAFNVAALVLAIMLVTFSDLAFGWSTTLEADPNAVTRLVQAIAWPWHAVAPAAVPSAALVEQSQFFRLEGGGAFGAAAPRALGAWWPFTVLAIVAYGLLPRVALLLLAAARARSATKALLLDDAGVTALLDRMSAPAIETAAAEHEAAPPLQIGPATAVPQPLKGRAQAVIWEGSLATELVSDYARRHLGLDVDTVSEAGGGRGLAADRAALARLAADPTRTLVVFTPAWEPPLLELLDFLGDVRGRIGAHGSIVVAPVPDGPRSVTPVERETWTRALARLGDPKRYVETGAA
jgi:hypothetical protein